MTIRQRIICYLLLVLIFIPTQVILQSYTGPKTIDYINFKGTQQQVKYARNNIIGVNPPETGNWIINETTYIDNEIKKITITGSVVISASLIILNSTVELSVSGKIYITREGEFRILLSNVTVFARDGIVVEGKMQLSQASFNFLTFSPRAYRGYSLIIQNKGTFEAGLSTLNGPLGGAFQNPIKILTNNATFKTTLSFTVRNCKFDFINSTVELSKVTFTESSYPIVLNNVTNSKIEDSFFSNEDGYAIILKNSENVTIINNIFDNVTGDRAIQIENSTNVWLERNTIRNTWGYSLYLKNTYNVTIINNTFSNNRGGFWKISRYGIHYLTRFYGGVYLENTTGTRFLNNSLFNETITLDPLNNFSALWIDNSNRVDNREIIYYYNKESLKISNMSLGEIILANCSGIAIENVTASSIELISTENTTLSNCVIRNGILGVVLSNVDNILVSSCNISYVLGNLVFNGTNVAFLNTTIHDVDLFGLKIDSVKNATVTNSKFYNSIYHIWGGNSTSIYISKSTFNNSDSDAIKIENCEKVVVEDNKISVITSRNMFGYTFASSIFISHSKLLWISRNIIVNSKKYGIYVKLNASGTVYITIEDNYLSDIDIGITADGGFNNTGNNFVTITGNIIYNATSSGIWVFGISNLFLYNNTIDAQVQGAFLIFVRGGTVSNNTFKNALYGLHFFNSNNTIVTNNTFLNSILVLPIVGSPLYNVVITDTNMVDGYPLIYLYEKNNVSITNQPTGEIIALNCSNVYISNITAKAIFISNVKKLGIKNVNFTNNEIMILFLHDCVDVDIAKVNLSSSRHVLLSEFLIISSERVNITGIYIEHLYSGPQIINSSQVIISNSTIKDSSIGILLANVHYAEVTNNTISGNYYGVYFNEWGAQSEESSTNTNITVFFNDFYNNTNPIYINDIVENVTVYFNNFTKNAQNPWIKGGTVAFDNGFVGNYWDNYNGTDDNNDGIGDTPYEITEDYYDNYPLMSPCTLSLYKELSERAQRSQLEEFLIIIIAVISVIIVVVAWYIHKKRKPKINIDLKALEYKHKLSAT